MVSSLYVRVFPPVGPPDPKTIYLPRLPKSMDVTGQILKGVTHLLRPKTINLKLSPIGVCFTWVWDVWVIQAYSLVYLG